MIARLRINETQIATTMCQSFQSQQPCTERFRMKRLKKKQGETKKRKVLLFSSKMQEDSP